MITNKSAATQAPALSFSTVVGKTVAAKRQSLSLRQEEVANALNISQSAYSRLETGETPITVTQLKLIGAKLNMGAAQILAAAEGNERALVAQGVRVVAEKPGNEAAVAIGLGILTAVLIAAAQR